MRTPLPLAQRSTATVVLLVLGCVTVAQAESQSSVTLADAQRPVGVAATESAWWRESVGLLGSLWDDARLRLRDDLPDWLHYQSRADRSPTLLASDAGAAYVVLQEDRTDGTDMVTLRYGLGRQGPLRAYAGAGLNHAQYYVDEAATGHSLPTRRNRHAAVGPAAELGAELALNERVSVNADVRWADFDDQADLLRGAFGPVAADPVVIGVNVGYRFR